MGTYTGRNPIEDIMGAVEMLQENQNTTLCYQGYNQEMVEVVEKFKSEHKLWMEGNTFQENAMTTVTQPLWHSMYLEKKRLNDLNIDVEYEQIQNIPDKTGSTNVYSHCYYRQDGKNLLCQVVQMLHIKKILRKGRKVLSKSEKDFHSSFYVTWARNEKGEYVCPNCGYEAPLQTFLDGCDYCGSKFEVEAFQKKIASQYLTTEQGKGGREVNDANKFVKYLAMGMISFCLTGMLPIFFFITIPLAIYSFVKVVTIGINNDRNGAGRNSLTKLDIRKHMPEFSLESFISSIDNKIKSVHFAENEKEIQAFCYCPMTDILPKYEKLAVCDNGQYLLKGFFIDTQRETYNMEIHMDVHLQMLKGEKLKQKKEKVRILFSKNMHSHMDFESDAQMFRCFGCGSTVSLVEGGICKFCDRPMNMIMHDWVITSYQTDL